MSNIKDAAKYSVEETKRQMDSMIKYTDDILQSSDKFINGASGRSSIVKYAKSNIFEFPVFISSSVSLDYATATTSLLEQVYASYLQMAISANPVVNARDAVNGHQFAHLKTNTNKYIEYTDMSYAHDACHAIYQENGNVIEFNMISIDDCDAKIINEHCDYEPLAEFAHFFQESGRPRDDFQSSQQKHTHKDANGNDTTYTTNTPSKIDREKSEYDTEKAKSDADLSSKKNADYDDDRKLDRLKKSSDIRHQSIQDREIKQRMKNSANAERRAEVMHKFDTKIKSPQFIDESKIKKLNTMKPLMMTVNLGLVDDNGSVSRPMEYIVGVKTHSRLIDADILPEVAEYPIREMDKISRKVKWRAGELKFFKDILFKIKQKKQTAIDSRDPKRKWYRRLYELAHMKGDAPATAVIESGGKRGLVKEFLSSILFKTGKPTGVMPNVTIVITKSDVDNIKTKTKIDLLKASTARNFCKELFLVALVVIDNDAESVKLMLPDLHNDYEVHSMASINKQLAELDTAGTKTRDMFKLLG